MRLTGLLAAAILLIASPASASNVGFQQLRIPDGTQKPLLIGIWYPTDAAPMPHPLGLFIQDVAADAAPSAGSHPLVVISHGTGGTFEGHYDTALALAHAGFVVASVSHTGDTYDDQSQAVAIWTRSGHIHRLIDYVVTEWMGRERVDADRVGVFGFSAGGLTALVVAGGTPNLSRVGPQCQAHPRYFECGVISRAHVDVGVLAAGQPASVWVHDPRIKAAVVAAPALGYTFGAEGLKDVRVPVQLWRAEDDHILPHPDYAEAVRKTLPTPPEFHLVENADHFDFLAPCSDGLKHAAPDICVSRPGFDRTLFHKQFDAEVVRFFEKTLGAPTP